MCTGNNLSRLKSIKCFDASINAPTYRRPVWPDIVVQSSRNVSKSCPKSSIGSFYIRVRFFNVAQKLPIFWATFVRHFVAKNFQKSPNLVTLWRRLTLKPEQTFRVELLRHLEQEIRFSGSGIKVDGNVADQDGDRDDQIRREKSVQIDSEL